MITMTIGELVQAREAGKELADCDLPIKAAYQVGRMLQIIDQELRSYEDQRQKLFQEYGEERDATPDEQRLNGQLRVVAVKPEHVRVFAAKFNELLAVPVEIDRTPIDLTSANGLTVKPRVLLALGPLITLE